jgi:hypothetical protein
MDYCAALLVRVAAATARGGLGASYMGELHRAVYRRLTPEANGGAAAGGAAPPPSHWDWVVSQARLTEDQVRTRDVHRERADGHG